jgi:hypothetical protein
VIDDRGEMQRQGLHTSYGCQRQDHARKRRQKEAEP